MKIEIFEHFTDRELKKHIQRKERDGYKLISHITEDIFWTFSMYSKRTTIKWNN